MKFVTIATAVTAYLSTFGYCNLLIRHPKILKLYSELTRSVANDRDYSKTVPVFEKGVKAIKTLCIFVITSDWYYPLHPKQAIPTKPTDRFKHVFKVTDVCNYYTCDKKGNYSEPLPVLGVGGGTMDAIPCARKGKFTLYIENSRNDNVFFTVVAVNTSTTRRPLVALYVRSAKISWSSVLHVRLLMLNNDWRLGAKGEEMVRLREIEFCESQRIRAGRRKKDICKVKGVRRYALCSLLNHALNKYEGSGEVSVMHKQAIRINDNDETCINGDKIKNVIESGIHAFAPGKYYSVELIPCWIGGVLDAATFYIAADQEIELGAFILEKFGDTYAVVMRLQYVHLLKDAV